MARKKKVWTNKKYGKQQFEAYTCYSGASRFLKLVGKKTGRQVEVESHEAAKKLGWKAS